MFDYFMSWFDDPINTLIFFLLAFPGRILALSVHEFAHAWMANRCGDPTAKFMGRMTLNPAKHLDPLGTIMMIFLGYGWAKPVPVNPNNFRNYRRDDLKVSLAGVTMNFIMFILGSLLMYAVIAFALMQAPMLSAIGHSGETVFQAMYNGARCLFVQDGDGYSYMVVSEILRQAPYAGSWVVENTFGVVAGYAFQVLEYFVLTNLVLGIFNLLPIPPLDGYHVLNDTLLRRRELFVSARVARATSGIMMILVFSGVLGKGLAWLNDRVLFGIGGIAEAVLRAAGII